MTEPISQKRFSILLSLGSVLYGAVTGIRNSFYDWGWLRSYTSPFPVISVGNITVGGNGKTPLVIEIALQLVARGHKPVVISRGYGGTELGPYEVSESDLSERVGDEPLLIRRRTKIPVVISRRRVAGAMYAEDKQLGDVFVLDDGFQHRALNRSCNIVCIRVDDHEAVEEFLRGELLPLGRFREHKCEALKRADTVVLVNRSSEQVHSASFDDGFSRTLPGSCTVFRSDITIEGVFALADGSPLEKGEVIALSGIANPDAFHRSLSTAGFSVLEKCVFADHHFFTNADLAQIAARFPGIPIVCTEKDGVKIRELGPTSGVYQLLMSARIRPEDAFFVHIERAMSERRERKRG